MLRHPAAVETATRALDQLGAGSGSTLLVNGASGGVGSAAVQLAVVRGSLPALPPGRQAQAGRANRAGIRPSASLRARSG